MGMNEYKEAINEVINEMEGVKTLEDNRWMLKDDLNSILEAEKTREEGEEVYWPTFKGMVYGSIMSLLTLRYSYYGKYGSSQALSEVINRLLVGLAMEDVNALKEVIESYKEHTVDNLPKDGSLNPNNSLE
jgi:hypothetical protein